LQVIDGSHYEDWVTKMSEWINYFKRVQHQVRKWEGEGREREGKETEEEVGGSYYEDWVTKMSEWTNYSKCAQHQVRRRERRETEGVKEGRGEGEDYFKYVQHQVWEKEREREGVNR
jgi:hypothetical protein